MTPGNHQFGVFLADGQQQCFETVTAAPRHLVADMAEKMTGLRAVAVTHRYEVTGRCAKCRAIVFGDERPQRSSDGLLRCSDC